MKSARTTMRFGAASVDGVAASTKCAVGKATPIGELDYPVSCRMCGRGIPHKVYSFLEPLCWNCHRIAMMLGLEPGKTVAHGVGAADRLAVRILKSAEPFWKARGDLRCVAVHQLRFRLSTPDDLLIRHFPGLER